MVGTLEVVSLGITLFPIYGLLFSMNRKLGGLVKRSETHAEKIERLEDKVFDFA